MSTRTYNTESIKATATVSFEIEGLSDDLAAAVAKALADLI